MNLYRWQQECLGAFRNNDYHGIIHVVTGAGKTRFALAAIDELTEKFDDLMIKIVVPAIPLAYQWQKILLHRAETEQMRPGFFGGERRDDPDRKVMIYIINSARDYLSRHVRHDMALGRHLLLICDECHHYQSRENRRIFSFLTPKTRVNGLYFSLGLSATPFGTQDDSFLIQSLGDKIYQYNFDDAVRDGVISPFTVCEVASSFYADELEKYRELSDQIRILSGKLDACYPHLKTLRETDFLKAVSAIAHEVDMDPEEPAAAFLLLTYQRKRLSNLALARIACGLSLIEHLDPSDRILVFCERISQVEDMAAAVRGRFGNICGIYHSEMTKDARLRVLNSFREGDIRILVSCRCLDEGIDVPDANIGIVLSSSAVERQRVQRLGRIVRSSPGKDTACLYYIYIRESSDDAAYLKEFEDYETFSLRYYPVEREFAHSLYEYAAACLLKKAEKSGYDKKQQRELRSCLKEGLVRADFLLPGNLQEKKIRSAARKHEKNYWSVMKKMGEMYTGSQKGQNRPGDSG